MAQAVSGRPFTIKARVQTQSSSCGICGEKLALEQVSRSKLGFYPVIISALLHTHISFI
jgi:hypothetical protein